MAQGVLDMAAEQPVHSGNARNEARRQLAIAFKLFSETIKAKVQKLYEHVDAKRKQRERYAAASTSAPARGG